MENGPSGTRNGSGLNVRGSHQDFLKSTREASDASKAVDNALIEKFRTINEKLQAKLPYMELRLQDVSYVITNHFEDDPDKKSKSQNESDTDGPPRRAKQNIETIRSSGVLLRFLRKLKRVVTQGQLKDYTLDSTIIENINLVFEPGNMVLLLGGPGSGKSTLLRCMSDILPKGKDYHQAGEVTLSGVSTSTEGVYWPSLVGFMDQIERLHAFLTVFETCEFAWRCRTGGTHRRAWQGSGPEIDQTIKEMNESLSEIHFVLDILGLTRVKDTFVGDQNTVRGVSGGEKKRVTVAGT